MPDYELLNKIGGGSYGEVWLARNVLGECRAVKVIYRGNFEHDRPFEREFEGIQKFEPISRLHASQVDILHVGRNDAAGYFYYVMELADGAVAVGVSPAVEGGILPSGPDRRTRNTPGTTAPVPPGRTPGSTAGEDARHYTPRTLKLDLYRRGRLPVDECIQIGLALTTALENLHSHGLVHRDIKPSNIIFVGGVPKLADIGLVASMDATMSFVGTSGFLPPEGPGTPQADIYSLGKVLYEISTGRDRQEFPKLPADLLVAASRESAADPVPHEPESGLKLTTLSRDAATSLLELNAVILKACHRNPRQRYQSAQEMAADMALLQGGRSVRRSRLTRRRLAFAIKSLLVTAVLGLLVIGGYTLRDARDYSTTRNKRMENPEVAMLCKLGRFHYYKITEEGYAKAMECFNRVLAIDTNSVEAYAGIADLCNVAQPSRFLPPKAAEEKMKWARKRLLAIDSGLAEGHAVQGFISLVFDWKPEEADKELRQALQLDPDLVIAHIFQGRCLLFTKKFDEAEQEFRTARRLDPTRYGLNVHVGLPAYFARRYDRAIEIFEEAVEVVPSLSWAMKMTGRANEEKGNYLAAIEAFQKCELAQGEKPELARQKYDGLREACENSGSDGYWRKRLEFVQRDFEAWSVPYQALDVAAVYAHLGDREMTFKWLDNAFQDKSEYLFWLNVDPCWDNVRADPRFVALVKKLGLATEF